MNTTHSALLSRHVALSAYAIAFVLVFSPVVDTAVSVLPVMPLEVSWRYRAANQISMAIVRPLLGVLLAYTVAVLLEHRRVIKAISLGCGALVGILVLGIPLFLMDALDMRAGLMEEAQPLFEISLLVALLKFVLAALVLATFALPGWNLARVLKAVTQKRPLQPDPEFVMPH